MANKIRGRNEGSIWQRGKRFRAAISLDGKRITKSFGTKAEARSWIREMQNNIDKGLTISGSNITLEQYLNQWMQIQETRLRPKSINRYKQIARDYVFPYIGESKLSDFRVQNVEDHYKFLLDKDVSVRNVRYVHSLLHISLKDAAKRGLVVVNAAHGARQPKMKSNEMAIFDEHQVIQFLMVAQGNRYETLFHLALKTGMRQGEILGLKWKDLDLLNSTISVKRQLQREKGKGMVFSSTKTKAGLRTIPLGDEMIRKLRDHIIQQKNDKAIAGQDWQEHNMIFPTKIGTPNSPTNLLIEFKMLLEKAGLPKIRFHDLRHTAASIMLNRGVPVYVVSRILGHSKPSTTMDIYGHLIPVMHEGIGNKMDEWLTPVPIDLGEKLETKAIKTEIKPKQTAPLLHHLV